MKKSIEIASPKVNISDVTPVIEMARQNLANLQDSIREVSDLYHSLTFRPTRAFVVCAALQDDPEMESLFYGLKENADGKAELVIVGGKSIFDLYKWSDGRMAERNCSIPVSNGRGALQLKVFKYVDVVFKVLKGLRESEDFWNLTLEKCMADAQA